MSEEEREWIITVDDQHLDQLDQIVAELEKAGLRVESVLYSIGQVTGCTRLAETTKDSATTDPARKRLTVVTGVASVDAVQHYRIQPPDAEIQ